MRSIRRTPFGTVPWALAGLSAAVGLAIVSGCAFFKSENGPQRVFARIGGQGGRTIEPKRCLLRVVTVSRPLGDPVVNDVVWRVADEQVVAAPARRALAANGLRVGRIIGELPRELDTQIKDARPDSPEKAPANLLVESGDSSLINACAAVEQVSLLLDRDERVTGKDYRDASGFFRVVPRHAGAHGVALRLVPEIHHGPVRRSFPAVPNGSGYAPQQLSIRDGQEEDPIRELAAEVVLEHDQVLAIGCRPEARGSLGVFLLGDSALGGDQRQQRLVLVWASRNYKGAIDNASAPGADDRPKLLDRAIGAPPPLPSVPDEAPRPAPRPDALPKNHAGPTSTPAETPTPAPAPAPTTTATSTSTSTPTAATSTPTQNVERP